ncbi:MAG: hypothetical protein IKN18_04945 [Neisseriaceae bacterium]|nr:hypothetical protein [Neisseriaceae bacterium]
MLNTILHARQNTTIITSLATQSTVIFIDGFTTPNKTLFCVSGCLKP